MCYVIGHVLLKAFTVQLWSPRQLSLNGTIKFNRIISYSIITVLEARFQISITKKQTNVYL